MMAHGGFEGWLSGASKSCDGILRSNDGLPQLRRSGFLMEGKVEPASGPHEYWLVTAPGTSTLVARIDYGGSSMADTLGIWMGSNNGLYLFTRAGGVARVSDLAGDPANGCINA